MWHGFHISKKVYKRVSVIGATRASGKGEKFYMCRKFSGVQKNNVKNISLMDCGPNLKSPSVKKRHSRFTTYP